MARWLSTCGCQRVVGAGSSALRAYATQATKCRDAVTCRWLDGCPPVAVHLCPGPPVPRVAVHDVRWVSMARVAVHGELSTIDSPMAVQIVWLPRWPAMPVLANQSVWPSTGGYPRSIARWLSRSSGYPDGPRWLSSSGYPDGPRWLSYRNPMAVPANHGCPSGPRVQERSRYGCPRRIASSNRASAMAVQARIHGWLS